MIMVTKTLPISDHNKIIIGFKIKNYFIDKIKKLFLFYFIFNIINYRYILSIEDDVLRVENKYNNKFDIIRKNLNLILIEFILNLRESYLI